MKSAHCQRASEAIKSLMEPRPFAVKDRPGLWHPKNGHDPKAV